MGEQLKRCILLTGGPFADWEGLRVKAEPEDLIIACDKGCEAARRLGLTPHYSVGDFDSFHGQTDPFSQVVTAPAHKDDTDTMMGVRMGLERGCKSFLILGGFGGRLDHTVANLQTLTYLCEQGAAGEIRATANRAWAVKNGTLAIPRIEGWHLSVFAWDGICRGVTLEGLEYPLSDVELAPGFPIGVSNEFAAETAFVTVCQGTLLVIASLETARQ